MKRIPLTLLLASLLFVLAACGDPSHSGVCTACPDFSHVNTDGCQEEAERWGCESAEVVEVTDDACAVGEEPQTHLACEYVGCSIPGGERFDCSAFAEL